MNESQVNEMGRIRSKPIGVAYVWPRYFPVLAGVTVLSVLFEMWSSCALVVSIGGCNTSGIVEVMLSSRRETAEKR